MKTNSNAGTCDALYFENDKKIKIARMKGETSLDLFLRQYKDRGYEVTIFEPEILVKSNYVKVLINRGERRDLIFDKMAILFKDGNHWPVNWLLNDNKAKKLRDALDVALDWRKRQPYIPIQIIVK